MRLSIASYSLLIIVACFLIQFELVRLQEGVASHEELADTGEQAREFYELYENIWKDLVYFPIPESTENEEALVSYENSWMFERTYGGSYGHEGTDLIAGIQEPGYYPVVSISDGVVEKIGWLEKGGWRIGIRSLHDVYFYYAHLDSYAEEFKPGDTIKAGQLLGFMGDTGYGKKEGTRGKFAVHLHLGIYIRTEDLPELAVNPYWFLKYLEENRQRYAY